MRFPHKYSLTFEKILNGLNLTLSLMMRKHKPTNLSIKNRIYHNVSMYVKLLAPLTLVVEVFCCSEV